MKHQAPTVADTLALLHTLNREELLSKWEQAYRQPPLKGARKHTLIRGLIYHSQCKASGGLKPSIKRSLFNIANGASLETIASNSKSTAQIGSQLIREWNGKTHTVIVTDNGYELNGIAYTSLSATAKAITGAHWSGPRFFGVAS